MPSSPTKAFSPGSFGPLPTVTRLAFSPPSLANARINVPRRFSGRSAHNVELQFYTGAEWVRGRVSSNAGDFSGNTGLCRCLFRRQQTQNPASRPYFLTEAGAPTVAVIERDDWPCIFEPVEAGS